MRPRQLVGSGKAWMCLWLAFFAAMLVWGTLTFAFWLDSVRNLNAISVVTVWAAAAAGIQATLSMRKSDPKDPL
jgi:hypothetical protein